MLEIVHDVAPGASLAFHTAFNGAADFADGIRDLANVAGARVITDDVVYRDEPHFSIGRMGQAINEVAAQGVAYFALAGNDANRGFRADWRSITADLDTVDDGTFFDFDGAGDILQDFTLNDNESISINFTWDSAYLEGGDPAANFQVDNDLTVYVVDTSNNTIVDTFNDDNANTDEAWEAVDFTNDLGGGTAFALAFQLNSGTAPNRISWITTLNEPIPSDLNQDDPTIRGHALAAGAVTVGAVPVSDPNSAQDFTSKGEQGVLDLRFDDAGNRLATPLFVLKPDLAAPNGGHTSFFGQDDGAGGFLFFGTSAAAPHAAAAAALLMQQAPTATRDQIVNHLKTTAVDLLTPGFDDQTGAGRVQLVPIDPTIIDPNDPNNPNNPNNRNLVTDAAEPNETSDAASDLGTVGAGGLTLGNKSIGITPEGFPDYDWYRFSAGVSGTYTCSLAPGGNAGLEIRLHSFSGGMLTELAVSSSSVSAAFGAGELVYVEVKGASTGVGTSGTGNYTLQVTVR